MHRQDAFLWENEVHDGKNGFLDFSGVACATDDDLFGCVVDDDKAFRVEPVSVAIGFKVRRMKHRKRRLMLVQQRFVGTNEHVPSEGVVPCVVVDYPYG